MPGTLILNGTCERKALESHGPPPFYIVCLRNHLQCGTSPNLETILSIQASTLLTESLPLLASQSSSQLEDSESSISIGDSYGKENSESGFGHLLAKVFQSSPVTEHCSKQADSVQYIPDPVSQAKREQVLASIKIDEWNKCIQSWVLKDPMFLICFIFLLLMDCFTNLLYPFMMLFLFGIRKTNHALLHGNKPRILCRLETIFFLHNLHDFISTVNRLFLLHSNFYL